MMISSRCHRVDIDTVKSSMMVRAVIEMFRVIVIIVVTRLHVRPVMVSVRVRNVMSWVQSGRINVQVAMVNIRMRHCVVKHIQVLDVVIVGVMYCVLVDVMSYWSIGD